MATPDPKNPNTSVRVQSGDTLSQIAKANGLTLKEIKDLNPTLMSNSKYDKGNKIFTGTKINIAPPQKKESPNVGDGKKGDGGGTDGNGGDGNGGDGNGGGGGNLRATPMTPESTITYTPPPPPVKTATPDIVLFDDETVPVEVMENLLFENIGGQELINIARSDTINGQPISYQPIKNISAIQQQYNPNNIVSLQQTSNRFFAGFSIKLEDKIPSEGNGSNGSNIYIDTNSGNLTIELVKLEADEQVEIQIVTNGTIYEDTIEGFTS